MLDIFGTFCPPCQKEAPALMQYQLDNADKFVLVGLTHFENVSDEYVKSNFAQKYNAYYFIANDNALNDRIAEQIIADIGYNHEIALPFKVVLKDGKYQSLTDVDSGRYGVKYYLGGINWQDMKADLDKIYGVVTKPAQNDLNFNSKSQTQSAKEPVKIDMHGQK